MASERLICALLLCVPGSCLVSDVARATSVVVSFEGVIESGSLTAPGLSVGVGDPVSGTVSYDPDALVDVNPAPERGSFHGGTARFDLRLAGGPRGHAFSIQLPPGPRNLVVADDDFVQMDLFSAGAELSDASLFGASRIFAQFALLSSVDTPIDGSPPSAEAVAAFPLVQPPSGINWLILEDAVLTNLQQRIDWHVTHFEVVPEPSTAPLLLVGLVGLIGARRSRVSRLRTRRAARPGWRAGSRA